MTRTKVMLGGALILAFSLLFGGVASAGSLSKSEWRAEAGVICSAADSEVGEIADDILGDLAPEDEPSDSQYSEFAERIAPVIDGAVVDVVDLEEPAAFTKNIKKWARATRATLAKAEDDPSLYGSPDPFEKAGRFARKLGLNGCA